MMEPGSPLALKLPAQTQAGAVQPHCSFGLDTDVQEDPDASSSCSLSQQLPLHPRNFALTKPLRTAGVTILDTCGTP